jgi:predicted permease
MSSFKDLRYAIRTYARRPVFTAAILLSLAFGIGANTAIFSVLNALMLRPLPVHDPASLYQVLHTGDGGSSESSSYAFYAYLKAHAKTIAGLFQVDPTSMVKVSIDGQSEAVVAQQVTGDYFSVLGVSPLVGAVIGIDDERGSAPKRVAVLSHSYWLRRFGGDPGVLGRTLTVDQVTHTVVGITRQEFFGLQVGRRVDVTVPLDGSEEAAFWKSRALVVRLPAGVSRETAMAELNVLFQQYIAGDQTLTERARARGFKSLELASSASGLPEFRDRYGKPVQATLAIVLALLLLACANLATLFLARAAVRQRDLSVCLALGASRFRLARQLLSETLLISLAGGALGLLVALWGIDVLVGFLPDFGVPTELHIRPDTTVLLFTLAASVLTGVSIGLAPVWLAGKIDLRDTLQSGGRARMLGTGPFGALVVVQVALSTMLVVAATLFAVSLSNLKAQQLGFVAEGVLTLTLDADGSGFEDERLAALQQQILQKLQALPGVRHATFATIPPLSGNVDGKPISIPGLTFASPDDGVLQVNTVGPDFFETFGVRLIKGRGITASDDRAAPQVAVLSESMAQYYFPGVDPIGRRMDVGRGRSGGQIEIVGVATDVRYRDLRTPAPRMVYVSAFQRDAEEENVFALRTAGNPVNWIRSAQSEIHSLAPSIPVSEVKTLVRQRDDRIVNERLLAVLSACFGGLAIILAAVGVYGVVTYSVTERTAELGLRIALGANPTALMWFILRGMISLIVFAIVVGVTGSFLSSSLLSSFLFGIQPVDPWVYAATTALLFAIGLLAAAVPTIRALRIDPVDTLRWH